MFLRLPNTEEQTQLSQMYYNQELGLCIEFGPVGPPPGSNPPCAGSRRHGLLAELLVIACYLSFTPSSLKFWSLYLISRTWNSHVWLGEMELTDWAGCASPGLCGPADIEPPKCAWHTWNLEGKRFRRLADASVQMCWDLPSQAIRSRDRDQEIEFGRGSLSPGSVVARQAGPLCSPRWGDSHRRRASGGGINSVLFILFRSAMEFVKSLYEHIHYHPLPTMLLFLLRVCSSDSDWRTASSPRSQD